MIQRSVAVSAGAALSAGVLAACGGAAGPTAQDRITQRLQPLALAASADALAARALAPRNPDRAAALSVIADERQVHATVLNDEVARLSPSLARPSTASGVVDAPTSPPRSEPTSPPGASTAVGPAASPAVVAAGVTDVDALRGRLDDARRQTAALAIDADGYRAGMLGSIAAAVAAEIEVQLS